MKILYGVQGTGNGHITRARAMATELKKCGLDVDYIFSGREPEKFFDMEVFGNYQVRRGLTFTSRNGRVRPLATLMNNRPSQFLKEVRTLDLTGYDLVITDFEPVTAWAAWRHKVRSLGIGHQYAFHHGIPQHHGGPVQHAIIKYFAPAQQSIGLHWHHFEQPILPPIAPVAGSHETVVRRRIVVYLPFESIATITALLKQFPAYDFRVYHPDATPGSEGHIHWHQPGRETFQAELHRCEGVICNAGFELASEVLQLGRKLLVKPVSGQSEQYSNCLALDLLGYGHVMHELNPAKMAAWLDNAGATRIHYPNVAAAICRWLQDGAQTPIADLAKTLWAETQLPDITAVTRTEGSLKAVAVEH